MINALTRIKYVPLAYNHASLHMNAILMTLMSHNMYHMLGTRLPLQIFCIVYRRCINCTQSACKQATPCLHTSFSLQAEGQDVSNTGDLSPIRQQHGKHHSSDANKTTCSSDSVIWATHEIYYLLYANNMASITQVMITRLHVAQRVFHTRFTKTIRIPRHHRIVLRATAAQRTTTRFTASFPTICRKIKG